MKKSRDFRALELRDHTPLSEIKTDMIFVLTYKTMGNQAVGYKKKREI